MSTPSPTFVFQRLTEVPADQAIQEAAEQCRGLVPQLEELAAMLCLSGQIAAAARVCDATSLIGRELDKLTRIR